jgi:hypothetical protein
VVDREIRLVVIKRHRQGRSLQNILAICRPSEPLGTLPRVLFNPNVTFSKRCFILGQDSWELTESVGCMNNYFSEASTERHQIACVTSHSTKTTHV